MTTKIISVSNCGNKAQIVINGNGQSKTLHVKRFFYETFIDAVGNKYELPTVVKPKNQQS